MVSNSTITVIVITMVVCFLLPVITSIYTNKKYHISFKTVLVGAVVFIVFSQILEKLLHVVVLGKTNIMIHPYAYALYGAAAAAVFEEFGRLAAFKLILKKARDWKDGLSYGIGHGGIEAVLIGGVAYINYLVYSIMINAGTFDKLSLKVPEATINQIKDSLINASAFNFAIGGFERIFAFIFQIALSILVLYSVKSGKIEYFIIALAAHFAVDFPAVLYQAKVITSIWIIESIVCIIAMISFVFIIRSRKLFELNE